MRRAVYGSAVICNLHSIIISSTVSFIDQSWPALLVQAGIGLNSLTL